MPFSYRVCKIGTAPDHLEPTSTPTGSASLYKRCFGTVKPAAMLQSSVGNGTPEVIPADLAIGILPIVTLAIGRTVSLKCKWPRFGKTGRLPTRAWAGTANTFGIGYKTVSFTICGSSRKRGRRCAICITRCSPPKVRHICIFLDSRFAPLFLFLRWGLTPLERGIDRVGMRQKLGKRIGCSNSQ